MARGYVGGMRRLRRLVLTITMYAAGAMAAQMKEAKVISVDEKAAVVQVVMAMKDAWNRHDMDAYGALLTEDCEWVNVVGMNWVGKAAVMKAHRAFHATMFKETGVEVLGMQVTEIVPGVMMSTSTERMGDYKTPDGRVMTGVEDRMTLVVVKQADGRWLVRSGHNTTIDPVAAKFDPGK
jgi:uncharacterized protein (TIGR02246 family)